MEKEGQRKFGKRSWAREVSLFLLDILYNAVVIILLVVLIRSFVVSPFRVVGASMVDTLQNGEFILIDKLSYHLGNLDRGDPIVFLPPATQKDRPKFEEVLRVGEDGIGSLKIADLRSAKQSTLCRNALFAGFFFCKDKVRENDLVYYAPLRTSSGGNGLETSWEFLEKSRVDKDHVRQAVIQIEGEQNQDYTVRIYSSRGPEYFVKRIIGVPGDTVKIDGGRVYLKEQGDEEFRVVEEPFLNEENMNRTSFRDTSRPNTYTVPEGHFFVLGDNRNHSNDSRDWKEPITGQPFAFVPEANISGRVLIVLWPLVDFRLIGGADL
ncbi:MAG: signal peptidase I [Candidatus Peregrinibacteria bacterium]|nr:signal peptidase I [Candidatus Peregrinibacteria bacterium]